MWLLPTVFCILGKPNCHHRNNDMISFHPRIITNKATNSFDRRQTFIIRWSSLSKKLQIQIIRIEVAWLLFNLITVVAAAIGRCVAATTCCLSRFYFLWFILLHFFGSSIAAAMVVMALFRHFIMEGTNNGTVYCILVHTFRTWLLYLYGVIGELMCLCGCASDDDEEKQWW